MTSRRLNNLKLALSLLSLIGLLTLFGMTVREQGIANTTAAHLTQDVVALEDTRNEIVLELETADQPIYFDLSDPVPLQGDAYDNIDQLEQTKRQLEQDIKRLELIQKQNQ